MTSPGKTPLVQIGNIYAKLECGNPTGSIKDRIAHYIIDESERLGLLKPGMRVVEATSGNTGIALGAYCRNKGYPVTIVMPENMTEERKDLMRSLGVDLVLCSKEGSFAEAATIRNSLAEKDGYFNPDQFSNPLNVECHRLTTGKEILDALEGVVPEISCFVAGIGTGGTIIGVAQALREKFPDVRIVAVEPTESAVMTGGCVGVHSIGGIGDGFIPTIAGDGKGGINPAIDEVICVSTEEAIENAELLREEHGFCIGVSSGANFAAARQLSKRFPNVVTVFADGYVKYVTQGLKVDCRRRCPHMTDRCHAIQV